MDKKKIKTFAVKSRKKLIEDIKYKASLIGITEDDIAEPIKSEGIETFSIKGYGNFHLYDDDIIKREKLVHEIENKGFNNVVEEVAYTWFNRIIAIRFMEVNNYLPTKTRVLSSETPGKNEPDIITEALNLDLDLSSEDKEKIFNLKDENKLDELFEFLFIKQCNKLNDILPGLFEKTEDYSELLLNISFIKPDGVIQQLIESIPEEDFHDQVEIIGWLYQYYISDHKKEVKDRKKSVEKESIPVVTQIFTTDWIVKYMVDNSLGKYWLERNPDSDLEKYLDFYIKDDEKSEKSFKNISIEKIKFFDPCMGSGHILVYAFEVFMEIYLSEGYSKKDASISIIENNLYGLDIDDRAYQLSYFAVMMKAREYNRSIFNMNLKPNIFSFKDSDQITEEQINLIREESTNLARKLKYLKDMFINAKTFGSLIQVEKMDFNKLNEGLINILSMKKNVSNYDLINNLIYSLNSLINQSKILTLEYDIVVTNPPYLERDNYNKILRDFLEENYKNYNINLFSAFIYRNLKFCKKSGYSAFMTPNVWMFIESYEELRKYILNEKGLDSLILLEFNAFREATVSICTFILSNSSLNSKSTYIDLREFKGDMEYQKQKVLNALLNEVNYLHKIDNSIFDIIPGNPIVFWVDKPFLDSFKNPLLNSFSEIKFGLKTGKNSRFIRYWFEVSMDKVGIFEKKDIEDYRNKYKWIPLSKGGPFRKWYGNQMFVVNWENDGEEIRNYSGSGVVNTSFYFKEFLTWGKISRNISFRYFPEGFIFETAGSAMFLKNHKEYIFGFLNSTVSKRIINSLAPTVNYENGDIERLPIKLNNELENEVQILVNENIDLCKDDWDDYETSWNFASNPLIRYKKETLKESFEAWKSHKQNIFDRLKSNEVRLNEIFADIYSMDVDCDVEDNYVKITKANYEKDIKDLISYAVGCIFGRYNLDDEGLICADNNFNEDNYTKFRPDTDAILPVLDTEYFEDDLVNRFIEFIKITFGQKHLDENLEFIAGALNRRGNTSKDQIRDYFLNKFFDNHCDKFKSFKSYKSPIYWQFDSGDENGFKCLIYLHRYDSSTVARIRTEYLHKTQKAIEDNIERCDSILDSNYSKERDKNKASDKKNKLFKQLEETRIYDEALVYIANQQIDLDLDDGVKENYKKFQNIEVETEGQKTKKINLLTKI